MGDRGNIIMGTPDKPEIYFYTHWTGTELPATLRAALIRGRERWEDASYLARVIFCEMVGDDKGVTGYGISATMPDNEHPLLFVDCETDGGRVTVAPESSGSFAPRSWTFAEFVKLDPAKGWAALGFSDE
jgi:hypothetical protein